MSILTTSKSGVRAVGAAKQRGSTLIITLIILALITLIVFGTFTASTVNLKSVGNMKAREEAIAAANEVSETLVGSTVNFTVAEGVPFSPIKVDINKDGVDDYSVQPVRTCIRALLGSSAGPSDIEIS